MCTLLVLHRQVPGAPLVAAGNRDEHYARPAEGPSLRTGRGRAIVAPRDLSAGGTWFGVNDAGVFAALTNVARPGPDPQRRSRGLLVVDALRAGSAREAATQIAALPEAAYNPFNLFVADAGDAFSFAYADRVRPGPSGPGLYAIGNGPVDAAEGGYKIERLAGRAGSLSRASAAPLDEIAALLREHAPGPRGPLDATCIHTPAYGTRSSFLLSLAAGGFDAPDSVFRFAEGAPCETGYEERTSLLRELRRCGPAAQPWGQTRKAS